MPVRPRPFLATATVVAALALSACGGDGDDDTALTAPTTAPTDSAPVATSEAAEPGSSSVPALFPCDALTAAEVGAIAGDTYTFTTGPAGGCEYKPDDVRGKPNVSVEIPDGEFELAGVTGATNVPGIGVSAYVRRDTNFPSVTIARVQLDAAGKVVQVAVTGGDASTRDATAEKLLRLAFTKV